MYKIIEENENMYRVVFNPSHQVYKAHFPNYPVTPGVCLLEVVGKLAERKIGRKLRFVAAKNVKFLSVLNPEKTPQADCKMKIISESQPIEIQATIETTEGVIAKMTTFYE